jgi:hypothetical protein
MWRIEVVLAEYRKALLIARQLAHNLDRWEQANNAHHRYVLHCKCWKIPVEIPIHTDGWVKI